MLILAPVFADSIFPIVAIPIFIGEFSFCLSLLVKGVNMEKWREGNADPLRRGSVGV